MNILYKTAVNRSPGDDMALMGTRKLILAIYGRHNAFVHDAGIDMRKVVREIVAHGTGLKTDLWHWKRSMKIDLVIIAGTPVWTGDVLKELEGFILKHDMPVLYVGVGTGSLHNERTPRVLRHCRGFVARDETALLTARKYGINAVRICCPSIFSVDPLDHTGIRVGIILQADTEWMAQVKFIRKLNKDEVILIAHHIEDYECAMRAFGKEGYEIYYSRYLDDLIDFYSCCRVVYSMRIHGAHLAFALGIPTVCLKSTVGKSEACASLGIKVIAPGAVKENDLTSRDHALITASACRDRYRSYLESRELI